MTPERWTQINAFSLSWTNPEANSNISAAIYKLGQPPNGNSDYDQVIEQNGITGLSNINVSSSGAVPIFVWLRNLSQNASYLNTGRQTLKYDPDPPNAQLLHFPADTIINVDIPIKASADDPVSGIETMVLKYRKTGDTGFASALFNKNTATIPAGYNTERGIDFNILAQDSSGNSSRLPVSGLNAIQLNIEAEQSSTVMISHAGNSKSDYGIFSVPFDLEQKQPAQIFEDDLGAYDSQQWRSLDIYGGSLREYPEFKTFNVVVPGKAFLLINNTGVSQIDLPAAQSTDPDNYKTILLQSGWDLIGNPFDFDIPLDSLRLDGAPLLSAWTLEGSGWVNSPGYFKRGSGLAIESSSGNADLTINLGSGPPSPSALPQLFGNDNWGLKITASSAEQLDSDNYIGIVKEENSDGKFILGEPPRITQGLALSIKPDVSTARLESGYQATGYAAFLNPGIHRAIYGIWSLPEPVNPVQYPAINSVICRRTILLNWQIYKPGKFMTCVNKTGE